MRFLIQAEWFFAKGLGSGDRQMLLTDLIDRSSSGVSIKRSIRFHDVEGRLSHRIVRWGRRRRIKNYLLGRWASVGKKRRRKLERLRRRLRTYDEECKRCVSAQILDYLRGCMVRREMIALEDFGGQGFRVVRQDEFAELLLLLERAHDHVWIFVFKDNDLLADKNDRVGYIM